MNRVNVNVLSAADTATQTGIMIDSSNFFAASFQAVFGDATAVGSINIQASNDLYANKYLDNTTLFTPTNWTTVGTAAVTAGASVVISLNNMSFRWLRVVYTSTSGGSTTVNVNMYATEA